MTDEKQPVVVVDGGNKVITGTGDEENGYEHASEETKYPRGLPFFLLSIGLMAVVLQVALDNYIIGMLYPIPGPPQRVPPRAPFTDTWRSHGHPHHHH